MPFVLESTLNYAPNDPAASELFSAAIENPRSMAVRETDSPVVEAGWFPHDMLAIGDGADGKEYDFDVDGAVASVVLSTFEAGFDYLVVTEDLNPFTLDYNVNGSSYTTRLDLSSAGAAVWSNMLFSRFAESLKLHTARDMGSATLGSVLVDANSVHSSGGAFTVPNIRINCGTGNFSSGRIYMYKRGFNR